MKIDLAVIGQGAVSPAGTGIDALLHREPIVSQVEALGATRNPWPVLRVDMKYPAFLRWQREPRLRRASPISFFLVEAAAQALEGIEREERAKTGLIVAFSAGCLAYSRRFFEGIVTQGQRTASPALFPETVFNSPVSHVASVHGLNGAAYALVGDESAWIAALQTASIWLRRGRVQQVLVLGVEEFDPLVLDAYHSARWLRRRNDSGFLTSEGAAGVLVRAAQPGDASVITDAQDGFIYRTKKEAANAAHQLIAEADPTLPVFVSAQHNWFAPLERETMRDRIALNSEGSYLGEAFTASAVWHTLRALHLLSSKTSRLLMPVWGLNHQLGSLELARPS